MIDYTLGLKLVHQIIIILILVMLALSVAVVKIVGKNISVFNIILVGVLGFFIIPICIYLIFFPSLFSILNLIYQNFLTLDFWKEELMSGVFAIRITSCVLTFKFISEFIGLVKSNNVFENNFKKNIYKLNSEENNIDLLDTKQASFLLQKDLFSMSTLQYAFYLSCVSSLWFSTINAYSTIIISLTSWCLFYIIDDWSIISDYSKEYKKTPMKSHKIKVNFFNVLLFSGTSIPLFLAGNSLQAVIMLFSQIFFAISLVMYYWRAAKVSEKIKNV